MASRLLSSLAALLIGAGCTVGVDGQVAGDGDGDGDGDGGDVDAGIEASSLSGLALDFAGGEPLPEVALSIDAFDPALTAVADAEGRFEIADIPGETVFSVLAQLPEGYLATHNPAIKADAPEMERDLAVVSIAEAQRLGGQVGELLLEGNSIVIAELLTGQGTPRDGVALADVALVDGDEGPAGVGPFFFGPEGLDPELEVSTIVDGQARVAFINVPPGSFTLSALYPGNDDGGDGGGNLLKTLEIGATADSAVLARVNDPALGGGGGGGGGGGNGDGG
jgi:hypothetical protein